jgi:hypothetical protein
MHLQEPKSSIDNFQEGRTTAFFLIAPLNGMKVRLLFFLHGLSLVLHAQSPIQIKGTVHDEESKKPLKGATITLLKSKRSTIPDDAGDFFLFIQSPMLSDTLIVSYLGYEPFRIPVSADTPDFLFIQLHRRSLSLPCVVIYGMSAENLLEEALARIPFNYDTSVTWLTGNYEVFEKEDVLVTRKLEAMIRVKRQPYNKKRLNDSAEAQEAHLVESRKSYFKTLPDLNAFLQRDAVKNSKSFLNKSEFQDFDYEMAGIQTCNGRKVYLIKFDQKEEDQKYTSWKGEIYLDSASLAFVKISYGISPKGRGHRTLPYAIELYGQLRKGFSMQLVVHDVEIEYDTSGSRWALKKIEWMNVLKWDSTRGLIPKFQMSVQTLRIDSVDRNQSNRFIDKTKLIRPRAPIDQIAPYNPTFWKDYNPPE